MHYSNPETRIIENLIGNWVIEYKQGRTTTWIADKYSVHKSTVLRRLKEMHVRIRSVGEAKLGPLNPNWLENPSVPAIHTWVRNRLPKPKFCQDCLNKPPYDLANISNEYNPKTYTRDLSNWEWLCRQCHMLKDGRLKKMYHGGATKQYEFCSVCDKPHKAKGYCERHYQQFKRLGRIIK